MASNVLLWLMYIFSILEVSMELCEIQNKEIKGRNEFGCRGYNQVGVAVNSSHIKETVVRCISKQIIEMVQYTE